jgi:hypothetical protein
MHRVLSALWVCLAAAWVSGITAIANMIGGYKYIGHVGATRPALMLILVAVCCIASAVALLRMGRFPRALAWSVGVIAGLHLFNVLSLFVQLGGLPRAVWVPFSVVSRALPTSSHFLGNPLGNVGLFVLPVATLLMLYASVRFSRSRTPYESGT